MTNMAAQPLSPEGLKQLKLHVHRVLRLIKTELKSQSGQCGASLESWRFLSFIKLLSKLNPPQIIQIYISFVFAKWKNSLNSLTCTQQHRTCANLEKD